MQPHRLDVISLIAGLVFVVIGAGYLLGVDLISRWSLVTRAWPLLLVAAGVALLIGARRTTDDD